MRFYGFNSKIPPRNIGRSTPGSGDDIQAYRKSGEIRPVPKPAADHVAPWRRRLYKNRIEARGIFDHAVNSPERVPRVFRPSKYSSRANTIAEIRNKIASGYYDSPEFVEKLADKLIEKFYDSGESLK